MRQEPEAPRHPVSSIQYPASGFALPSPNSGFRSQVSRLREGYGGHAGFTLVELMTVIAIIAILAGLVLGISGYATKKADQSRAMADMEKIKNALEEYRLQYGEYPFVLPGYGSLTNLAFAGTRERLTNSMQNAVRDLSFVDPWGNSFFYSRQSQFVYVLSSWGPDMSDTNDNITAGLAGL